MQLTKENGFKHEKSAEVLKSLCRFQALNIHDQDEVDF